MRFALDLIWLDSDDGVLAVLPDVPPCASQPCPIYEPLGTEQSQGVLEVSAGAASRHGILSGTFLRRQEASTRAWASTSKMLRSTPARTHC